MREKLRMRALAWVLAVLLVVGVVNVPPRAGEVRAEEDNQCLITFISEAGFLGGDSALATKYEIYFDKGSVINSTPSFYSNDNSKLALIGWKLNNEGDVLSDQDLANIAADEDMTFYAQTVHVNKVTFEPGNPDEQSYTMYFPEGSKLDYFSEPASRSGYKFTGWKINNEGDTYSTADLRYYVPTSDVTLYGQWEALVNYFTVKFVSDEGYIDGLSEKKEYTIEVEEGSATNYKQPSIYGYPGYAFDYWVDSETGEKVDNYYNFVPTKNVTLKAVWRECPTYKITYVSEEGYIGGDKDSKETYYEIEKGNNIFYSYPLTNGRPKYARIGWKIEGTNTVLTDYELRTYVPTQDTTFHVVWGDAYTVTYSSEEGYIYGEKSRKAYEVSVAIGDRVGEGPSIYGNTGHTFVGWKINGEGEILSSSEAEEYVPNGDVTFVAQWENAYKVTFKSEYGYLHGSKFSTEETVDINYGYPIYSNAPEVYGWPGHAINGWKIEGEDRIYTPLEVYYYRPESDVTFVANWVDTYKITFESSSGYIGGDNPYAKKLEKEIAKGTKIGDLEPEMGELKGYVFSGWKEEDGTDIIEDLRDYVPSKDTVFVAVWEKAYIITFVSEEGYIYGNPDTKILKRQIKEGERVILSGPGGVSVSDRSGYIFDHWSVNGKKIEDISNYIPEGDVTIKANWVEAYDVTFESDAGYFYGFSENKKMVYQVKKGEAFNRSANTPYNRPGYAFTYWSYNGTKIEDIYAFVPKGNVTIKANWAKAVKVTLDYDGGYIEYSSGAIDYLGKRIDYIAENTKTNIYPDTAKRDGQIFIGWKIKDDPEEKLYANYEISDYVVGINDITFVAQYGKSVNVYFDPNGGYFYDGPSQKNYDKKKVEVAEQNLFNQYIFNPGIDENSGKMFLGWKLEGDTSSTIYATNDIYQKFRVGTEDITFVAQWEQGIVITFDMNGGYYLSGPGQYENTISRITIPKGGKVNDLYISPLTDVTRNYFAGWAVDYGSGNVSYYTKDSIKDVTFNESTTVKAVWNTDGYTVKFVSSEGYLKYSDPKATVRELNVAPDVEYGNDIPIPIYNNATNGREGYYLDYWTRGGDSKHYTADDIRKLVINADTIFTAKWAKSAKVTFDANGGALSSGPDSMVSSYVRYYIPGDLVYMPTPSYDGYTFQGWSERKADGTIGKIYQTTDGYKATTDVTFTAVWKNNKTGEVVEPSYLKPVPAPNPAENVQKNNSSSKNTTSTSTQNGNQKESKKETPKYSEEWINGKWYDKDGNQTYDGTLSWKSDSTGWWVEDSAGWYPVSQWQKIDGIWYYFNASGYMASGEYYNGYWFNSDGSWDSQYYLSWKSDSTGWWVEDVSGWWPSSSWLKVDGYWYYFNSSGYMVTNQYVDGYWIGSDGVCS